MTPWCEWCGNDPFLDGGGPCNCEQMCEVCRNRNCRTQECEWHFQCACGCYGDDDE